MLLLLVNLALLLGANDVAEPYFECTGEVGASETDWSLQNFDEETDFVADKYCEKFPWITAGAGGDVVCGWNF